MDEIYIEIAEKLKADDKLRRTEKAEAYDEGVTKGISEGIREGISQGISQGKIEQNKLRIGIEMIFLIKNSWYCKVYMGTGLPLLYI